MPMMKSAEKITVRAELNANGSGRLNSIYGEFDAEIPPTPKLVAERIALLKMCDVGARVDGVGKRQSELIFYLHFTSDESKRVTEELQSARRNAVDG